MKKYPSNATLILGCAVLVSGLYGHEAVALETCESVCNDDDPVTIFGEPCLIRNFLKNGCMKNVKEVQRKI